MAKIPIKFKRVAAAFDEAVRWRRPCGSSSGSEYWPESGTDLSDLVNSFIEEGDYREVTSHFDIDVDKNNNEGTNKDDNECDVNWVSDNDDDDIETRELLGSLLLECRGDDDDNNNNGVKKKISDEIEVALKLIGDNYCIGTPSTSRSGLKRNLMVHLRDKGFDAGLCKSRWEKTGRFPAGTYEYIDVNVGKARYIIEVFLAGEFEIARPTTRYTTLQGMIPSIMIIEKPQVLKQIVRLMSGEMKKSLKHVGMHVAPWRRNGYMQAKYMSPYKRTTNRERELSGGAYNNNIEGATKKAQGFSSRVSYYCRVDDFASKVNGVRVGLLAAALQGNDIL